MTSLAETEAELGTYQLFSHDREDAHASIEQALHEDAGLALAHETQAFLDFADGRDEHAKSEFAKAYAVDPQRYVSLYYSTMLSPLRTSTVPADQMSPRVAMYDVLKANPRFAPAAVKLALVLARQGNYPNALNLARKAESLEPSRAGYHLLVGRVLLVLGRNDEAAKQARFVADRWNGPDRDEAMELWSNIPAEKRPPEASMLVEVAAGTQSLRGTLLSVSCGGKEGTSLVLQNADGTKTFRMLRRPQNRLFRHSLVRHGPFHAMSSSRWTAGNRPLQAQHGQAACWRMGRAGPSRGSAGSVRGAQCATGQGQRGACGPGGLEKLMPQGLRLLRT
jgi:Anaphase-promoting complex, cyclosome, subunit 3